MVVGIAESWLFQQCDVARVSHVERTGYESPSECVAVGGYESENIAIRVIRLCVGIYGEYCSC